MNNILFRCDGSVEIGMGHIVRCMTLADELTKNHNCKIHFAIRKSELGLNKIKEIYSVLESNEFAFFYENWLEYCVNITNAKVLILDVRDGLSRKELKSLKKKTGIKVITIDDPEEKRLESDLALYPPVPQLEKTNWDGYKGDLRIGWEYVILRKDFLKSYTKLADTIPNILVFMGGTDEKNMTRFVIDALDLIDKQFSVTIILGAGYQYREELENRLELANYSFIIEIEPENIAEIISQSDLGIISFGMIAYELAALKIPAIYMCITPDHEESSKLFVNEGIGVSLGQYNKVSEQDIVRVVLLYITEKQILKKMVYHAGLLYISNINKISNLILG